MQRQHVPTAVLRAGRLDRDGRLGLVEPERARRQAADLLPPQAGEEADEVGPRPGLPVIALDRLAPGSGRLDQAGDLLGRERAPPVPDVGLGVQPLHADQRVRRQPLRRRQPPAEGVGRLEVVVVRPGPQILGLAGGVQPPDHLLPVQLGEGAEAAALDHPADAGHGQPPVLGRVVGERAVEGLEVALDRRLLDGQQPLLGGVDHPPLAEHGLVLELGGELLGQALVGEPLGRDPPAFVVEILDVVGPVLLPLVPAQLEDRGHRAVS
nr:hypothetical protein [Tautonia rosea]